MDFLDTFSKNIRVSNSMKIRPVGTEFFHTDRLESVPFLGAFAISRTLLKIEPLQQNERIEVIYVTNRGL